MTDKHAGSETIGGEPLTMMLLPARWVPANSAPAFVQRTPARPAPGTGASAAASTMSTASGLKSQ